GVRGRVILAPFAQRCHNDSVVAYHTLIGRPGRSRCRGSFATPKDSPDQERSMPLLRIRCPQCDALLKSAAGFTPGNTVVCPKCTNRFPVPPAEDAPADSGGEEE